MQTRQVCRIMSNHVVKPSIFIFCVEKELLAYKVKGKDGILADEDSDGKWLSVIENIDYCMQSRKQPIRWLHCHKIFTGHCFYTVHHHHANLNCVSFQVFSEFVTVSFSLITSLAVLFFMLQVMMTYTKHLLKCWAKNTSLTPRWTWTLMRFPMATFVTCLKVIWHF